MTTESASEEAESAEDCSLACVSAEEEADEPEEEPPHPVRTMPAARTAAVILNNGLHFAFFMIKLLYYNALSCSKMLFYASFDCILTAK